MEIMMGSADARKVLSDIFESLPKHRRAVIEEITYSDCTSSREDNHQDQGGLRRKGCVANEKQNLGSASCWTQGMA